MHTLNRKVSLIAVSLMSLICFQTPHAQADQLNIMSSQNKNGLDIVIFGNRTNLVAVIKKVYLSLGANPQVMKDANNPRASWTVTKLPGESSNAGAVVENGAITQWSFHLDFADLMQVVAGDLSKNELLFTGPVAFALYTGFSKPGVAKKIPQTASDLQIAGAGYTVNCGLRTTDGLPPHAECSINWQ